MFSHGRLILFFSTVGSLVYLTLNVVSFRVNHKVAQFPRHFISKRFNRIVNDRIKGIFFKICFVVSSGRLLGGGLLHGARFTVQLAPSRIILYSYIGTSTNSFFV